MIPRRVKPCFSTTCCITLLSWWESDAPYGTIHRIASCGRGGVFEACLAYCLGITRHLRIDTHHDNKVMQHVVEKHGFTRRGIIYIADGSPRIAYERT